MTTPKLKLANPDLTPERQLELIKLQGSMIGSLAHIVYGLMDEVEKLKRSQGDAERTRIAGRSGL